MTHYETLGIKSSANADEIRRAFRKLAVQFHPDRHPGDAKAEGRYRTIAEAYDILSDAGRRKKYDRELAPPVPEPNYPSADVSIQLDLEAHELRNGCDKTVTVSRPRTCPDCRGGGRFNTGVCNICGGGGCQPCGFSGRKSCARCWGSGKDRELTTLVLKVPAECPPHGRKRFMAIGSLWGQPGPFYVWANVSVKVPRAGLIIR
jgi:molecular chaperone DnaJ